MLLDRTGRGASGRDARAAVRGSRARRLGFDPLEGRALLAASLAPIANITAPAGIGYQVPLNGSGSTAASQTFTVTSSNPLVQATVAQGQFLSLNVSHTSSGPTDPAFTGTMVFQLFGDLTPVTVSKIEQLVTQGFYNGKNIHRIASGFPDATGYAVQGGSVDGKGTDQPPSINGPQGLLPATGFPFPDEFNQSLAFTNPGQLAMANAGDNTNTSQFFITNEAPRFLDFGYNIFGQLVSGTNILTDLTKVAVGGSAGTTPLAPVTINSAALSSTNPNGVIHIDTTAATAGQSSTVTVTAFDASTSTSATRTFTVDVGPTNPSPGPTEKPFLTQYPTSTLTTQENVPATFTLKGVSAGFPNDSLTYTVQGPISTTTGAFTTLQNATASVDASGNVTVTPNPGFTGTITGTVGVRDQVDRTGQGLGAVGNFDTRPFTLVVTASTIPSASPVSASAYTGGSTTIQLVGKAASGSTNPALSYAIVSQPSHGTLSNFNATAGTVTYTPTLGFSGTDAFTYHVTDTGVTPNQTSAPATVTITDAQGVTGAVRLIQDTSSGLNVLVVTPPPNRTRHRDIIAVNQANGAIQVEVNGITDSTQPAISTLEEIVVYGSKTGNTIVISPAVTLPTSVDGGHGGLNFIHDAASSNSRIHGWFGRNVVQGGPSFNAIVGRRGHLRVIKGPGTDSVFLSDVNPYSRVPHYKNASFHGRAPLGAFYKFVGNRLVRTNQPASVLVTHKKA